MAPPVLIALVVSVTCLLSAAPAEAATAGHRAARFHATARRAAQRKQTRTGRRTTRRLLPTRPFAPTSFWNAPLPPDAALDPLSRTYVTELRRQVDQSGAYVNTTRYSAPVYVVPAEQRMVHLTVDSIHPWLEE